MNYSTDRLSFPYKPEKQVLKRTLCFLELYCDFLSNCPQNPLEKNLSFKYFLERGSEAAALPLLAFFLCSTALIIDSLRKVYAS